MDKEFLYVAVADINTDEISGTPQIAEIQQQCNAVVNHMNQYKLYITDLNITSSYLPLLNIRKNIIDFTNNRTNLVVSMAGAVDTYTYSYDNSNPLYFGINEDPLNPNMWQGIGGYLQYVSFNQKGNPNPAGVGFVSSTAYPNEYFDIFAVDCFINMFNTATTAIAGFGESGAGFEPVLLSYNGASQLYTLQWEISLYTAGENFMYFNWPLSRWLDGFPIIEFNYPSASVSTDAGYDPRDYLVRMEEIEILQQTTFSVDSGDPPTTITYVLMQTEYSCVGNMISTMAVLITTEGALSTSVPENIPSTIGGLQIQSLNLPSQTLLKYLPINSSNVGLSNSQLIFEDDYLRRSIKLTANRPLTDIKLKFFFQDSTFTIRPLLVPSNQSVLVRFALERV